MPDDDGPPQGLSRRTFIELAGAAGVVGAVGVTSSPAGATPVALTTPEQQVLLQIAAAGAVFPIPFPEFGENGPASSRATLPRLAAAVQRLGKDRLALAKAGAGQVIGSGLAGVDRPTLLTGLGRLAADDDPRLNAVVALAVATVSAHFDPDDDAAARLWLGGLHELVEQGQLPRLAQERAQERAR